MSSSSSKESKEKPPPRWYFSKDRLRNTPSFVAGMSPEKELSYRQQCASLVQDLGQKLKVTQLVINTAICYMHRFYMFQSFSQCQRHNIAACAIFLSAKVEEQPKKLANVIMALYACLHRDKPMLDPGSEEFKKMSEDLVANEMVMLQTLGFDVSVDHPHAHVIKATQLIHASKELSQTAYFMATNSLHLTTLCLEHQPSAVACVCIHLAYKWANLQIPKSKDNRDWWTYVDRSITKDKLDALAQEFLSTLEKTPSKLKKKLSQFKAAHAPSSVGSHSSSSSSKFPSPVKIKPEPGSAKAFSSLSKPKELPSLPPLPKQQLKAGPPRPPEPGNMPKPPEPRNPPQAKSRPPEPPTVKHSESKEKVKSVESQSRSKPSLESWRPSQETKTADSRVKGTSESRHLSQELKGKDSRPKSSSSSSESRRQSQEPKSGDGRAWPFESKHHSQEQKSGDSKPRSSSESKHSSLEQKVGDTRSKSCSESKHQSLDLKVKDSRSKSLSESKHHSQEQKSRDSKPLKHSDPESKKLKLQDIKLPELKIKSPEEKSKLTGSSSSTSGLPKESSIDATRNHHHHHHHRPKERKEKERDRHRSTSSSSSGKHHHHHHHHHHHPREETPAKRPRWEEELEPGEIVDEDGE